MSTLVVVEGVKKNIKKIIMIEVQKSWYFKIGPIAASPFQLITIYPKMNPMIPYNEVEAPALIESV